MSGAHCSSAVVAVSRKQKPISNPCVLLPSLDLLWDVGGLCLCGAAQGMGVVQAKQACSAARLGHNSLGTWAKMKVK